jgi:plasmid stability protein
MASLIVRNLAERTKERLRVRAARHGRSMEAEARAILEAAVTADERGDETLGELVARCFGPEHGFDIEPYLPPRPSPRDPPSFE